MTIEFTNYPKCHGRLESEEDSFSEPVRWALKTIPGFARNVLGYYVCLGADRPCDRSDIEVCLILRPGVEASVKSQQTHDFVKRVIDDRIEKWRPKLWNTILHFTSEELPAPSVKAEDGGTFIATQQALDLAENSVDVL